MRRRRWALVLVMMHSVLTVWAQGVEPDTAGVPAEELRAAAVTAARKPVSRMEGAQNGMVLSRTELFRAACCNLGESFTTNPSVDVSYNDAATGAKQIRLLGLAGTYVQMLTENVPDLRGAAAPFSLGYVPGTWMQSIQVSKGCASVKNGYESITGQIDVEYKKPQAEPSLEFNLYGDTKGRVETNFDGNLHLNDRLSTGLLVHYEDNIMTHDGNGDGFVDKPNVRQGNLMSRWAWMGDNYIFQAAVSGIAERRKGGQTHHAVAAGEERYRISMETTRFSGFVKNAFLLDKERNSNIALIVAGNYHDADAVYGRKVYDVTQKTGYASLIFESDFTSRHNLSAGLSINHDHYAQRYRLTHGNPVEAPESRGERETVPGIYAQYTLNLDERWVVMAGVRADHSSVYGTFVTPRFHAKWVPGKVFSLRVSAGKGYRTVHPLAEFNYLMASNRRLVVESLRQEAAWNYGASMNFKIPMGGHILDLSAEYYYTRFSEQAVIDYDTDPAFIYVRSLGGGRSYSHTVQVEATYPVVRGLTLTAAYRYNDVRQHTGGKLREKILTGKYKALFTASYKTPLELWQFDLTAQLTGGGRLPQGTDAAAATRYPAFARLNAQVTRWFRHWSIYVGGENLANYKQKTPILAADDPWGSGFDATQVWGPVHGAMGYVGVRINY